MSLHTWRGTPTATKEWRRRPNKAIRLKCMPAASKVEPKTSKRVPPRSVRARLADVQESTTLLFGVWEQLPAEAWGQSGLISNTPWG